MEEMKFTDFMRFIELNSDLTGKELYEYAMHEWNRMIEESRKYWDINGGNYDIRTKES